MPIPIIDLFAGPGGLGEGFASLRGRRRQQFFKIGLSIEKDPIAHRTLTLRAVYRQLRGTKGIKHYYKDACWTRIQNRINEMEKRVPAEFNTQLLSPDQKDAEERTARQTQRIDNGIEAQRCVLAIPAEKWKQLHQVLVERAVLTPKEIGIVKVAMQIPSKIPTEKQCLVLLGVLDKGKEEGITVD
ncbi:MAG: hypothetical protein WDZ76_01430 [Pseudohongiellaceae bacterium]